MTLLVTGGAGFIGSNFVIDWLSHHDEPIVTLDKLTYAGNRENLKSLAKNPAHIFVQGDIGHTAQIRNLLSHHRPRAIINFAAESHVDRSLYNPGAFVETNIMGTFCLLESARDYWQSLPPAQKQAFRVLQISTDEVYGTLTPDAPAFCEDSRYAPNSPYSASKAAADHLVRAYHHSYGLPVLTTNCSNNYGPYQFPEKLIPLMIRTACARKPLPVYGDGLHIRDWLYVGDHCRALRMVLEHGRCGEVYNIGGLTEQTNLALVHSLCDLLDRLNPLHKDSPLRSYRDLITFVTDRPGHDRRYAIDATKITTELGWRPTESLDSGLHKTVRWYLDHKDWCTQHTTNAHDKGPHHHKGQMT